MGKLIGWRQNVFEQENILITYHYNICILQEKHTVYIRAYEDIIEICNKL